MYDPVNTMLNLIDLGLIFLVMMLAAIVLVIIGNYWYKNLYLPSIETAEPPIAEGLKELFENVSVGFTEALKDVKVDIDMEKISASLTESFFGSFIALLGVGDEISEDWTFQSYIKDIIDSSIETIVPETVKQFEEILPQFADQFITGIQEALTGAVSGMPEAPGGAQAVAPAGGVAPDLDVGKMIQMMLLQYMVKSMGGAGGLGSLLGGLGGGVAPTGGSPSSGF